MDQDHKLSGEASQLSLELANLSFPGGALRRYVIRRFVVPPSEQDLTNVCPRHSCMLMKVVP